MKKIVLDWNNTWRRDYWWRQKHNIPFNSVAHREVTQLDIAFEYIEHVLSNKAVAKIQRLEENEKLIKEGQWIKENKGTDVKEDDKLFEKMSLD